MSLPGSVSFVVREIARISREHVHERKLLLSQSPAQGRELLRATALAGQPWLGWEVTTPRTLASHLIVGELAQEGRARADEFDLLALTDAAIDTVVERGLAGPFGGTAGTAGYREAIRRTLYALREGGVTPEQLRRARPGDPKLQALASLLAAFEQGLRERRLLDPPALMRWATEALEQGRARLPEGRIFVLAGQSLRGVSGRFLQALLADRVQLLAADPVVGMPAPSTLVWTAPPEPLGPLSALHAPRAAAEPPTFELFAAATPTDELREVLRRVVAKGIPWDQVEIVTTDPVTYGAALDALTGRLDIPVNYARGLDSRRTRSGRSVEAYLRWIGEDFPADVLRAMLESGDLAPPADFKDVSGSALARRLRRLRIGWGRRRYLDTIERALQAASEPVGETGDADPEEVERWRGWERRELAALRALLHELLSAVPEPRPSPRTGPTGRGSAPSPDDAGRTSPAALAAGVLAFLPRVPESSGLAERTMRKMLRERLSRIRDTLTRETAWDAAIDVLRANLVTRIAPAGEGGLAPWTSTGGLLYLSDLTTGGLSQRPHVFVVGMDASRVAGSGGSDPLLTDADRIAIASQVGAPIPPLATSAERVVEARHALAATLSRLRGAITLSYSAWESAEGRSISPAPELLQALRLREGDETLAYQALREEMGSLVGAVPTVGALLDGDDVWLDAIAQGRRLREGTAVVRAVFPGLEAGSRARAARESPQVTAYDGVIAPRPELDPLAGGTVFSASRLEALGTCPRRYLYQYVLGVFPVEDPVLDPDVWLDPRQRGSVLHAVYERTLSEARARGIAYEEEAFASLARQVLSEEAEEALREAPPPSPGVLEQELADLREEVGTWVAMIRLQQPDWLAVELRFGPGRREAEIPAGGGRIRLRGAIDRVDRLPGGGVRIVDYKTGSPRPFRVREPFAGGRRLQHLLYTLAAERLLGERVVAMEYQFPTRKGELRRVAYGEPELARGPEVLEHLLQIAANGHFVTTEEVRDCRFCPFAAVCRVREESFGHTTSARATWSKTVGMEMDLPPYLRLKALRAIDG